jgi:DNA-binding transcriptional MerR regulator
MKLSNLKKAAQEQTKKTGPARKRRQKINIIDNYMDGLKADEADAETSSKVVASYSSAKKQKPISNQKVTNREPIGKPKGNQLVSNKESIGNQGSASVDEKNAIGNQLVSQKVTNKVTNRESISNQKVTTSSFKELVGKQLIIVVAIFNDIKFSNSNVSNPISLSYLAKISQTTCKTAKTSTQRLVKKGVITRVEGKRGKGGWVRFSIKESIYNEMLQSELVTIKEPIGNQLVTNWGANKEPNREPKPSSSNSSIINNTNTTEEEKNESWLDDMQTPDNLKQLGFGLKNIKQLKERFNIEPEEIQRGMEAFAFDISLGELERLKKRGVQSVIGYFFSAMKSGGYNSVNAGFLTSEERAEKDMLERLEAKKEQRQERDKKIKDLLFEEWLEDKSDEELISIAKPVISFKDNIHLADLKGYFLENEISETKLGLSQ